MFKFTTKQIAFSGLFLAIALVLPFFTGQIETIGNMLLPMHLPVLLCGLLLGPVCGGIVGFVAPLLRSMIWGMPYLLPTGVAMAFELMAYGIVSGILISVLSNNTISTYLALIGAMIVGRIFWGVVSFAIYTAMGSAFTIQLFFVGAFTNAIPGIILQLVIIPPIVVAVRKYTSLATA
ncbi:MAG: ECF transporter S component [Bacillota bacterium]